LLGSIALNRRATSAGKRQTARRGRVVEGSIQSRVLFPANGAAGERTTVAALAGLRPHEKKFMASRPHGFTSLRSKTDLQPQLKRPEMTNFGRFRRCFLAIHRLFIRCNRHFKHSERLSTLIRSGTILRIFLTRSVRFHWWVPNTVHALIFGLAVDTNSKPIDSNGLRPCCRFVHVPLQTVFIRNTFRNSHLRCSSGLRVSGR